MKTYKTAEEFFREISPDDNFGHRVILEKERIDGFIYDIMNRYAKYYHNQFIPTDEGIEECCFEYKKYLQQQIAKRDELIKAQEKIIDELELTKECRSWQSYLDKLRDKIEQLKKEL